VMKNKISVFLGSSGVGKSSLINQILEKDYLKTEDIRVSDAQGRHTTVNRELIRIDDSTAVIDTPGIRVISAASVSEEAFEDVLNLADGCRFKDCSHRFEIGCMVKKAINEGLLSQDRLNLYLKAMKVNAFIEKREATRKQLFEKRFKRK